MSPMRADILKFWINSALTRCVAVNRNAVTVEGIALRIERDTGLIFSAGEIAAEMQRAGLESGACMFSSCWAEPARLAFSRLVAATGLRGGR